MSNVNIRTALETRLKAAVAAYLPGTPVAYQNIPFTKPTTGLWLESYLIPNETPLRSVDGAKKTYLGLYQVNIWAQAGTGMRPVETAVDLILSAFPVVPKVGTVSVEKTTAGSTISDDAGWLAVPVLINYRYET